MGVVGLVVCGCAVSVCLGVGGCVGVGAAMGEPGSFRGGVGGGEGGGASSVLGMDGVGMCIKSDRRDI